jgi:hypothetical protein
VISQIELFVAICKDLERQGHKDVIPRHVNAIIRACDDIIREFQAPHMLAEPASGLDAWLRSDDTGSSSMAMANHLVALDGGKPPHVRPDDRRHHPADPSDLGRCIGLLAAVPELRPHLPAMAAVSPAWAALIGAWDELEALYAEEAPGGKAPRTYRRMRELLDGSQSP